MGVPKLLPFVSWVLLPLSKLDAAEMEDREDSAELGGDRDNISSIVLGVGGAGNEGT